MGSSPTSPSSSRMRVGIVSDTPAAQADWVWVLVDGGLVQASYLTSYVPVVGDRVIVTQDGADWFVLGGKSGYAGNLVINPDFLFHPQASLSFNGPPDTWAVRTVSGAAASVGVAVAANTGRTLCFLGTTSTSAAEHQLYSASFPVTPGTTYRVDAAVNVTASTGGTTVAEARLAWFGDGVGIPPSELSQSLIGSQSQVGSGNIDAWLQGSAVAPDDATYARFLLRATVTASGAGYSVYLRRAEVHP